MNICIAGSRNINNVAIIQETVLKGLIRISLLTNTSLDKTNLNFVVGGAKGVDTIAEEIFNAEYKIIKIFPDWNKYGKRAGYKRNAEMIKISDGLIVIWDGQSKGTKNTIDLAIEKQIPIFVEIVKEKNES